MDIILYSYNCRSERVYYMPNNIRNTIAHEFGHILGLEHHINQTRLMYGSDYVVDPFPALGYTVPEEPPEGFIGEQELLDRYWELGGVLNETKAALIELDGDIERYADRYAVERSDNAVLFETDGQVGRYNGMIREYNALVDKYNEQVNELNCMYESVPPTRLPPRHRPRNEAIRVWEDLSASNGSPKTHSHGPSRRVGQNQASDRI